MRATWSGSTRISGPSRRLSPIRVAGSSPAGTSGCPGTGIGRWRRGRGSSVRSHAGGSRAPRAGGATPRSSWLAAAMTCATCARTARRGLTGRAPPRRGPARRARAGSPAPLDGGGPAREPLAHPLLPRAFKRAGQDSGPDELHELLSLWHNQRRSILTSRQHLLNEAEHMLCGLPLPLREQLPDTKAVRLRLAALAARNRRRRYDQPTTLRLKLLDDYRARIAK